MFYYLNVIGTMAFAVSASLTAMNRRLDPFGVFVIAFATSVGGGTLRDILIGYTPVGWMRDLTVVYFIIAGYFVAVIFRKKLDRLRVSLFLFDTIGLGIFTLIGIERGLSFGLAPVICVALGTVTACFGGVIRDILCNEIPVIFRKEIYATLCIVGGIIFFTLRNNFGLTQNVLYVLVSVIIIVLRLLAVRYKWYLAPLDRK
ncbi:trimeric intracellular cation channel family protein [Flavobacterium sp.]|uniref:trimeric intracellular cation channel family protein n=1 Tax=Flavobacterium sp. TaxID=239 RepID=UPI0011FC26C4|nr:trimeric intracellular cation channel family protein [Flavobacterium sp.]RZJ69628.1 MAG: trimeric intracellular cation channel family protein [Flavobacterium sp.]